MNERHGLVDVMQALTSFRFLSFNVGAILVCLTCLMYVGLRHRSDRLQNKLFLVLVIDVIMAAASDLSAGLARACLEGFAKSAVVQVSGYVYFATHIALAPLFLLYAVVVCREMGTISRKCRILAAIPFFLSEFIALTNPLTQWVYTYGPDMSYTRNWAMFFIYAVGLMYLVLGSVQLTKRWHALTITRRRGLIFFLTVAGAGVVIQLLVPPFCIELFAESLAVLGVMLFVEDEDEYIEFEANLYNRRALEADLDMYMEVVRSFNVVVVRVTNVGLYLNIGSSTPVVQTITEQIADYFRELTPWYHIYRATPMRFAIIDPHMSHDKAYEMAQKIADRFGRGWRIPGVDVDIDLRAAVALARIPDDLSTPQDVLYLIDTPMPPTTERSVFVRDDFDYLVRRAEVERAVRRGFDEGGYEVYYQPIYNGVEEPCSAEALMRLHDSVLGDVAPFEFIEVAERIGLVDGIGEFALREVCAFIASGVPEALGIDHINVNLSVIQCMQAGFAESTKKIVESYGIDPGMVTFEITESVAAQDYKFLAGVMGALKGCGHRFAMDDFGTGYSNMHSLVALDFDVVKIDKSVLWDAEKSESGRVVLTSAVSLAHNVNCDVLVEGVETKAQVNLLHSLGVDYYQGFYYAKPMPKDELSAFLGDVGDSSAS